jgi:hypothetical protein
MLCQKFQLVLITVALSLFAVHAAPAAQGDAVELTARGFGNGFRGNNFNRGNNNKGGNNNNKGGNNNNNKGGNNNNNKGGNNNQGGNQLNNGNSTGGNNNGGNNNNNNNNNNPQDSRVLSPQVIAAGFEQNGQETPTAGQVASLTSSNNFINFCLTVPNLPLTNGKQISTGSCNPAPMGIIPSTANMPSAKFIFPPNGGTIQANTNFTVQMAIQGMQTGFFVNADANYFAAPQQVNAQGQVQGHSHVVIEALSSLTQTTPTDPTKFAFFKGLNNPATNGVLSAAVAGGLPAGTYKISSINTAANHQPVLVPVAQHGSLDDVVYFTVTNNGQPAANSGAAAGSASNSTAAANTPSSTPAGNANAKTVSSSSSKAAPTPAGKGSSPGKKN